VALKKVLNTLKSDGYIIKKLDQYLLSINDKDEDRRWDINSPSSAGACPRGIVYSRLGYEADINNTDARTRRIFDNGTHVHLRLQEYMLKDGQLAMDEVPVFDDDLQMQGHTDGLLNLSKYELGILEIKSINDNGFKSLVDAKEEHKQQAQSYMYCLENRRKWLKERFNTIEELEVYTGSKEYENFIRAHYKHIKDGSKHTAEEKFQFKLACHTKADIILWSCSRPINKMVFLYENKNDQEFKEYTVKWNEETIEEMKVKLAYVNKHVAEKKIPPRPEGATSKSCQHCRWCRFRTECWVV
jgi:hypothetical protein